jgi:signal transduction histidine kinase
VLQSRLKGSEHAHRVDEIVNASERATELTRRLLAFGRRQEVQPRALAIGEVVTRLEPLLRRTIPGDVELAIELEQGVAPVLADPSQIEQVLVNLVVNSRDAMPTGGTITIAVHTSTLTYADPATSPPIGPGSYVTLSVSDTGEGIDLETLPHIFEPFFTTKDEGVGSGLGLATVHGITAQCGGGIRVDSRPGAGTTIAVFLPAARP